MPQGSLDGAARGAQLLYALSLPPTVCPEPTALGNAPDGAILRTRSPAPVAILQARPGGSLLHAQGPARPQATEDEALRAAVAEARQGGGSSANLFLFLIYSLPPWRRNACGRWKSLTLLFLCTRWCRILPSITPSAAPSSGFFAQDYFSLRIFSFRLETTAQ